MGILLVILDNLESRELYFRSIIEYLIKWEWGLGGGMINDETFYRFHEKLRRYSREKDSGINELTRKLVFEEDFIIESTRNLFGTNLRKLYSNKNVFAYLLVF